MREILEEIVHKVRDPRDHKVWFKYIEQEGKDFYGDYIINALIVRQNPGSRIIYKQTIAVKEPENTQTHIDRARKDLQMRLLTEVFRFGIFSAQEVLEKYDKDRNSQ